MTSKKWYLNPEMLVALSALFIGLLTAVISVYSAYIDRAYARASVWPRLELYRSLNANTFSYGIANRGTGPAIIKHAKVKVNGSYIKKWRDLDAYSSITQSHMSSTTLPSETSITPLLYQGDDVSNLLALDESLQIELCYCSIYGECWLINRTNETQQVEQCSVDAEKAFLQ